MEKTGDVEATANLEPTFYVREINIRCPKGHCQSVTKNKEDTYWEHHDEDSKDKEKAKSHDYSSANQPWIQAPKKDKHGCWCDYPATGVNVIKVAKKNKDKD